MIKMVSQNIGENNVSICDNPVDLENKVTILYLIPRDTRFKELLVQQGFRYFEAHPSTCLYKKIELQNYAIHESIVYKPTGFYYIKDGLITLFTHRAMFIPFKPEMPSELRTLILNNFRDILSTLFFIEYEEIV